MKSTTFFTLAFGLLSLAVKGQNLNLNDCIKLQKK